MVYFTKTINFNGKMNKMNCFNKINILLQKLLLRHYHKQTLFFLTVDFSLIGLGCVLRQGNEKEKRNFFSTVLEFLRLMNTNSV